MRKISLLLAIITVMCCFLASCGGSYKAFKIDPEYVSVRAENPNQTISGVDGVKKSVPKDTKSIICFNPASAAVLGGVGANALIKGVDTDTKAVISTAKELKITDIAAQSPDLVFITDTYDTTALDNTDIPYFTIPETMSLNDVKMLIKVCEKVVGYDKESLAAKIDNESSVALQTTNGMANKYKAFIDLGSAKTTGMGTYVNEVLSICGLESIFSDREGFFKVTKDEIIKANPEFIFTTENRNNYLNDDAYADVKAVKNNCVFQIRGANIQYGSHNVADAISEIFQRVDNFRTASLKK